MLDDDQFVHKLLKEVCRTNIILNVLHECCVSKAHHGRSLCTISKRGIRREFSGKENAWTIGIVWVINGKIEHGLWRALPREAAVRLFNTRSSGGIGGLQGNTIDRSGCKCRYACRRSSQWGCIDQRGCYSLPDRHVAAYSSVIDSFLLRYCKLTRRAAAFAIEGWSAKPSVSIGCCHHHHHRESGGVSHKQCR